MTSEQLRERLARLDGTRRRLWEDMDDYRPWDKKWRRWAHFQNRIDEEMSSIVRQLARLDALSTSSPREQP
jgi:hypothetical protein